MKLVLHMLLCFWCVQFTQVPCAIFAWHRFFQRGVSISLFFHLKFSNVLIFGIFLEEEICIDGDSPTTGPVMFLFFKIFPRGHVFRFRRTDGPCIRTVHCGGYFPDWIHTENAIYFRYKEVYITLVKGD